MSRPLPKGFKLGVASPAMELVGDDKADTEDSYKSYQFYLRDVPMVKWLGVNFHRFTISWPRIMPTGFADNISKEGSAYYRKFIDALIARGIEPMVTMHYHDLPWNIQDLGGWTNPLIVDWFEDYARVLFNLYGDRVKSWITINGPRPVGLFGGENESYVPGVSVRGVGEYLAAKHMVLAHAKAWRLYDREFRKKQNGTCSIAITTNYFQGRTDSPSDVEAGSEAMDFEVGLYAHPVFSAEGGFPASVARRVAARSRDQGYPRSRLPDFTDEERELVKGTSDFYGLNYYTTRYYSREGFEAGSYPVPSCDDDLGAVGVDADELDQQSVPLVEMAQGIRKALKWVKETYSSPLIMITENGYGTVSGLQDDDRMVYLKRSVDAVLDAMAKDDCRVIAYTVSSLMDYDFEQIPWSLRYGLFERDIKDKDEPQRARASAFWYRKLNATRTLDLSYKPTLRKLTF